MYCETETIIYAAKYIAYGDHTCVSLNQTTIKFVALCQKMLDPPVLCLCVWFLEETAIVFL